MNQFGGCLLRRSLAHLAYLLLLLVPAYSLPAHAELVTVSPVPLVADGQTISTIVLYDTQYMSGTRYRVKTNEGRAGTLIDQGNGFVSFDWTPHSSDRSGELRLDIRRRGASSSDEVVQLPTIPPYAGGLEFSFDPEAPIAGQDTVVVRIKPSAKTPQADANRRLLIAASQGTIEPAVPTGEGEWIARYTPPANLADPTHVVLTAVDHAATDAVSGWSTLPIKVRRSASFQTVPDSQNILKVGDRPYGPNKASPAGTVAFDIIVDPRVNTAELESVAPTGDKSVSSVPLPLGTETEVVFFPLPGSVPAKAGASLQISFAAVNPDGTAYAGAAAQLTTSAGTVSPAMGRVGVFGSTLTPPISPEKLKLVATVNGKEAFAETQAINPLPRVEATADPNPLPDGTTSFGVQFAIRNAAGEPLRGRLRTVKTENVYVSSKPASQKDGTYKAKYRLKKGVDVAQIRVIPKIETSKSGAHDLVILPPPSLVIDGEPTDWTVAVVDAFGLPLAKQTVKIGVPRGDATAPAEVTTNSDGIAEFQVSPGQAPGINHIRIEASGLFKQLGILQHRAGEAAAGHATGGTPAQALLRNAFGQTQPTLKVGKKGAVREGNPPAAVVLSSVPPFTTPGANILVNIQVVDSAGGPVAGAQPQLTASIGTLGEVVDNGNGTYSVTLQLAAGQDGPVQLQAVAESASAQASLVPMGQAGNMRQSPGLGGQGGARAGGFKNPFGGGGGPAATSGPHKMRVMGGLTGMAHDYSMTSSGTKDAPEDAAFSSGNFLKGQLGGAPAVAGVAYIRPGLGDYSAEVALDAWYELMKIGDDTYDNLGYDLRLTAHRRNELAGGRHTYMLAGLHRTTALIFRYGDETQSSAELLGKRMLGVRVGYGAGITKGMFTATAEGYATWSAYILPVIGGIQTRAMYEYQNGQFAFLSFGAEYRSMRFRFDDTDEEIKVKDQRQPLTVGIGGVFR